MNVGEEEAKATILMCFALWGQHGCNCPMGNPTLTLGDLALQEQDLLGFGCGQVRPRSLRVVCEVYHMDGRNPKPHHFKTMVETIVRWYLQGNHHSVVCQVMDFVHPQYGKGVDLAAGFEGTLASTIWASRNPAARGAFFLSARTCALVDQRSHVRAVAGNGRAKH